MKFVHVYSSNKINIKYSSNFYTVSQEPQCARFRRIFTRSPIVSWDTVFCDMGT